jgi:hypothetical protein
MKQFLIAAIHFVLFSDPIFSQQTDTLSLRVQKIKELKDCFVIEGIRENSLMTDTVFVLSEKSNSGINARYEKIDIGRQYQFVVSDFTTNLAAMPPNNFVLKFKTTVVWRSGDGMKKKPVFAKNTRGLFIQRNSQ